MSPLYHRAQAISAKAPPKKPPKAPAHTPTHSQGEDRFASQEQQADKCKPSQQLDPPGHQSQEATPPGPPVRRRLVGKLPRSPTQREIRHGTWPPHSQKAESEVPTEIVDEFEGDALGEMHEEMEAAE